MPKITLRLPREVHASLALTSEKEGRTVADVVRRTLTGKEKPVKATASGRKPPRKAKTTRKAKSTRKTPIARVDL